MAWYWYDLGPLGLLDTRIFTVDSGFDSVFIFGLDSFVFCCRYRSLVLLLRFFGSPDFQRSEALVGQTSVAPFFFICLRSCIVDVFEKVWMSD